VESPANTLNIAFMRFLMLVLFVSVLLGTGCATGQWQAEKIPAPSSTPFDSNQFARNAYLEGFRHGYRAQTSGGPASVETIGGPYVEARRLGFYAGAAHGRAESAGADAKAK
jgi:hypothetical protein